MFLNSCFQDWKWNKHHKFDTSSYVQMFENIQNILFTFFDIFSLILCYFWRQNCLKTSILLLWATLVNTCWPYVCDITKWSLGARKYLSQVPSPQISRQEIQNSSRGVEKTIFLCLQAVDGITTFKSDFLKKKCYNSAFFPKLNKDVSIKMKFHSSLKENKRK